MRIQKIICDKCNKEIKKNPLKVYFEEIDRDSADFITNSTDIENMSEITNMDFCKTCMSDLQRIVRSFVNVTEAKTILDEKAIVEAGKKLNKPVKKNIRCSEEV